MELQEMFMMQKGLDRHIEENHQLENEDLFDRRILALLVELGELANETRCFKFWSIKPSSPKEIVLEEFVDGIHFILSLGIESGLDSIREITPVENTNDLNEQFLKIYEAVLHFRTNKSEEAYQALFSQYLTLGAKLGFSAEDIKNAYISKNEVNYQRQEQGY